MYLVCGILQLLDEKKVESSSNGAAGDRSPSPAKDAAPTAVADEAPADKAE